MKSVQIEKAFLLSYNDLYSGGSEPAATLRDLPQTAALEVISYLLHLYNVRKRNDTQFQSRHLMQWMMQMENNDKIRLADYIQQQSELIFDPAFKVISRRPCLDLIQHILVYSKPDNSPLNRSHFSTLFKCLLHFNSLENKAQEQLFNWSCKGNIEKFANHILIVQVRNIEHERFKDYVLQFLKLYYFFQFCESNEKYSTKLKSFLASLGLSSYESYLWKLINPYLKLLVSEQKTPKMYIDDGGESMEFYDRLTINNKITATDKDYKPLRQYPLFKSEKNTYVFMDFGFFVDKFYQGFLFDFASQTNVPYGNLKTDMANSFSEHILFYTVMNKCYGRYGTLRLTGEEIKEKIGSGEPDYYIRKESRIFLFEFKDLALSADIKYASNPETIKQGLFAKLERNTEGKGKGITQLLRTAKNVSQGVYAKCQVDSISCVSVTFYPIIVHTDIALESCGVNYFLNQRMLELIDELGLRDLAIKDLILINIDTLIQLQDHFDDGKLDLEDCLNEFLNFVSTDEPQTATYPFDEFVKYYFVKKTKEQIRNPNDFEFVINSFTARK